MSRLIRALQVSLLTGVMAAGTVAVAQPPGRGLGGDGPRGDRGGDRGEQESDRETPGRGESRGPGFGGPGFGGPGFGRNPGGFDGRRGGGPPPDMMMRMLPALNALDADHDGTISESEINNAAAALKSIDKNSDGKLTPDELRPDFGSAGGPPGGFGRAAEFAMPGSFGPPGGRGPGTFLGGRGRPPADGDQEGGDQVREAERHQGNTQGGQRISADELSGVFRSLVMRSDTNRDGFVTGDELIGMLRQVGGDRPSGDRPSGDRPSGDRPSGDRPSGDRPPNARTDSDRGGSDRRPEERMGERRPESGQTDQPRRGGFGGPPRDADPGRFFAEMFRARDQNEDGVLKGDEIPSNLAGRLEQVDRDGDGAISRQEMEGMMSRMREGGGRPGGRDVGPGSRRPGGDLPRRPETEE